LVEIGNGRGTAIYEVMRMRKYLMILGVATLMVPVAALAVEPVSPEASTGPAEACRTERGVMGPDGFKQLYGTNKNKSNAFGKCVSKKAKQVTVAQSNAAKQCRAEQESSDFAATHGDKTFEQFYGTNKNGSNAFGKCVSAKAKETVEASNAVVLNAAKRCKTERASDRAAFKTKYGTNKKKSNAYGKCVSKLARES
jgi:hypothetical protein